MYLVNKNKDQFFHVGIEASGTALKLPAGIYDVDYDHIKSAVVFKDISITLGEYYDLQHDVQADIRDEIEYFFSQNNQRGILVHGAAGNGKTRMLSELIKRACAAHDAVALINPDIDYMSRYVEAVRADDPGRRIIVFWDEFDELLRCSEHEVLRLLDGAKSHAGVLTIAALNDLDDLEDRIYKRPGRFGLVAELEQPCADIRRRFAQNIISDPALLDEVVACSDGLSLDYVREIAHRVTVRGQSIPEVFKKLKLDAVDEAA